MEELLTPFAASGFTPFAAVFCVLTFADSFCEDYASGYVRFLAVRTGRKRYARTRSLTVMLSGGLLMMAVVTLVIIVSALRATAPETEESARLLEASVWYRANLIVPFGGRLMAAGKIILAFLFGCLWALVGLAVSTVVTNRYITMVAPFVIYQLFWMLLSETRFNPVYLLRGDADFLPSLHFVILYQTFWILVLYIVSCRRILKKVETL